MLFSIIRMIFIVLAIIQILYSIAWFRAHFAALRIEAWATAANTALMPSMRRVSYWWSLGGMSRLPAGNKP